MGIVSRLLDRVAPAPQDLVTVRPVGRWGRIEVSLPAYLRDCPRRPADALDLAICSEADRVARVPARGTTATPRAAVRRPT